MGIIVFWLQHKKHWKHFIPVPAHQWMRRMCGQPAYDTVWKPLLVGKFHQFYDRVSMAWLWSRLFIRGNSKGKKGEREKLGYFKGGFQVLIATLQKTLEAKGVSIRTRVAVESIRKIEAGIAVACGDTTETFDRLICTTPSHVLALLLKDEPSVPADYLARLKSIDYLGAVCVIFASKQSLSPYYWHNVVDEASPFLACIEHTNFIEPSFYQDAHVYYLGTYVPHDHPYFTLSDEQLRETFFASLPRIFPAFDPSQILETHIARFKNAQHVVDCQYPEKLPPYTTPLPGVYLANFSQIFPEDRGTNFAVREGRKIAGLCLRELAH